jgi:phytoene/squalene synthetase
VNAPAEASAEPKRPLVTPADLAACREMIRTGSKTFHTSSSLFPRRIRDASRALYGFCRVADDAVDQSDDVAVLALAIFFNTYARGKFSSIEVTKAANLASALCFG